MLDYPPLFSADTDLGYNLAINGRFCFYIDYSIFLMLEIAITVIVLRGRQTDSQSCLLRMRMQILYFAIETFKVIWPFLNDVYITQTIRTHIERTFYI